MAQRAACVIGWPVEHSRSPLIHNYWIRQHGLDAEYRREAVRPEEFAGFVARLAERGYVGANVTLPHKEAALAASQPDNRARAVGAANTLWLEDGRLQSTNTDVEGFVGNLDASVPGWDRGLETAIVLGAGGGACAVVFGLIERGVPRIEVVNRSMPRAQALCRRLGAQVRAASWETLGPLLPSLRIARQHHIARHERAGRAGARCDEPCRSMPPLPISFISRSGRGCSRRRPARGLRTADGLGMLLHQAVRGFSLWFGVQPAVTAELRTLVESDLARNIIRSSAFPLTRGIGPSVAGFYVPSQGTQPAHREVAMHHVTRRALAATGLALVFAASTAFAQQPQTVRIRGQIEKVDGQNLTIKARDGSESKVKLAEPPRILGHGQVVTRRHQGRLVHRRVGHAAAGRQPKGVRHSHFHGFAARRGGRSVPGLGQPAGQHHDQRQCRHHGHRQGRPGAAGQIQGRREEGHCASRYSDCPLHGQAAPRTSRSAPRSSSPRHGRSRTDR